MNQKETIAVLAVLKTAYPQFYRGLSPQELQETVTLWSEMFAAEDFQVVKAAVKAHIATDAKGYPPHIGAIKAAIRKITQPDEMSEMEAWGYVSRALRNSSYNSIKEFERLPPVVRRIVGAPSQLREWAAMDTDTVQSVVQSNFMRSYRARAQHEREYLALPPEVKGMMEEIAAGFAMPALKEGDRSYDLQQIEGRTMRRFADGD